MLRSLRLLGSRRPEKQERPDMHRHILGKVSPDLRARSPSALLDLELIHERASSLGRLGRALEAALHQLAEFDACHPREAPISLRDRQPAPSWPRMPPTRCGI